jgi:hypothetical protein
MQDSNRLKPTIRSWLLILLLPAIVGCGSGLASVSGTVTLDGQPIAGGAEVRGTVTFTRPDGSGVPAVGVLDENGRYELSTGGQKGVPPGSYQVAIVATRIIIPEPGATPSGRPITPRQYASAKTSGLTAEVTTGDNTHDFPLESRNKG